MFIPDIRLTIEINGANLVGQLYIDSLIFMILAPNLAEVTLAVWDYGFGYSARLPSKMVAILVEECQIEQLMIKLAVFKWTQQFEAFIGSQPLELTLLL